MSQSVSNDTISFKFYVVKSGLWETEKASGNDPTLSLEGCCNICFKRHWGCTRSGFVSELRGSRHGAMLGVQDHAPEGLLLCLKKVRSPPIHMS